MNDAAPLAKPAPSDPRVEWLDAARGVGIMLVVIGHALGGLIDSALGNDFWLGRALFFCIYTFHMPLFMMLSGLLVSARLDRSRKRFRDRLWTGIAWPYFLWSAVQLTVILATGSLVNQPLGDYFATLATLPWHTVSQFWFLYVLFLLHVLSMVALKPLGREGFLLLCLALKPLALILPMPEVLRLAANHALFYGIGVWLTPDGLKSLAVDRSRWFHLGLLGVATGLVGLALSAADTFDVTRQMVSAKAAAIAYLAWRYEALPAAIAGAVSMVALASMPTARLGSVLALLGRRSMAIFVLHIMAIAGVRIVLIKFFHVDQPWPIFAIACLAGLALPLLADAVIRQLRIERWLGLA
ncbi:acyltransferase [Novosphingobium sp. MMS21-SN21R]|uniref:acyltransferase family protein n=1 Tax=Novosphingobium sp. MMS21-SN21R TaxID=2969298 RepID=UPI0028856524|nr:acyltransferase [Novosphingobium sp. MMS21-SN21R]MDT0508421.1 acyltransferase [Novosphingobium sp. MMS21-SN21R]